MMGLKKNYLGDCFEIQALKIKEIRTFSPSNQSLGIIKLLFVAELWKWEDNYQTLLDENEKESSNCYTILMS